MNATCDEPGERRERARVAEFRRPVELSRVRGALSGTTTLLRGLIAAVVIARAERLADLVTPDKAFAAGALDRRVSWDAARAEFRAAQQKVAVLAGERARAVRALSRLPVLRRDAGAAYDAVTAADDALRTLAGRRVAAERSLRAASYRYAAAAKAADAHARAKPGLRALLVTGFSARREWRDRQALLDRTLRDHAGPVDSARRAAAEVQAQFAATVRDRAEAAATLRRLTVECAAAREAVAQARERWGERFPETGDDRREATAPRAADEFTAARTELFLAALTLHRALIAAQARRATGNLLGRWSRTRWETGGVLDHLSLQCADMAASATFYDAVLAPLGGQRVADFGVAVGYGTPPRPDFWISRLTTGDGFRESHVAFTAPSREAVRAFFAAAVAAGAEVLHEPRLWPEYHEAYYGAFVRDPDGNNVEAVCHRPE